MRKRPCLFLNFLIIDNHALYKANSISIDLLVDANVNNCSY